MSDDEKLKEIKRRAKTDYFFLAREVLGYSDLRPEPHREICHLVEKRHRRKKLILMPRGSFKSSLVTVGYPLRRITQDPNIRILISSETQKNAKKFAGEIKTHLESNAKFKALFGNFESSKIWRDDEFIINNRTKVVREATVTAASLERQNVTGKHFDLIIMDDCVGPNTINTPEQIEKTIEHYKLLLSVLDPGHDKQIIIIGTRWHAADLYSWILDPDNGEHDQFDIVIKDAEDNGDGKLLLPDRLTREFLEEQRKTQGEFIYNAQYRNQIFAKETATFRPEHIQFYEKSPKNLYYFLSVDPAIAQHERADYSAFILNGVDFSGNWWVKEAIQGRMDIPQIVETIFSLVEEYNPQCVAMEKFMLEKTLIHTLNDEMVRRGVHFPIKEVQTNTKLSKEARIKALQFKFEAGEIFIKKDMKELYLQILNHPQLKHDDLLDALKTQRLITYPCDIQDEEGTAIEKLSQNEKMVWNRLETVHRRRVKEKKWTII